LKPDRFKIKAGHREVVVEISKAITINPLGQSNDASESSLRSKKRKMESDDANAKAPVQYKPKIESRHTKRLETLIYNQIQSSFESHPDLEFENPTKISGKRNKNKIQLVFLNFLDFSG
jgi:hypothetical protein